MILGQPGTDQYRIRVALVFGSLGVLMILAAWGMWAVRESDAVAARIIAKRTPIASPSTPSGIESDERLEAARALPLLLLFIFFVVLTILVGSFVIVRAIRRHRDALEHQRANPTNSSDVWVRHRVPDYDDDERY